MAEDNHNLFTVRDYFRYCMSRLRSADLSFGHGAESARDEAGWLLQWALALDPEEITEFFEARLTAAEKDRVLTTLEARMATRKPLAYLINEAWIGEHRFYVDERVIVPRSFIGEILGAGTLDAWLDPSRVARTLDLCTGSGCLAILLALTYPNAQVDAIDLSEEALAVAGINVANYGLEHFVRLLRSDLLDKAQGPYDLIISNPPYVDAPSMEALPAEYRHEPDLALASGDDGLAHTHRILRGAREHLAPGGLLVVEIGHNREILEATYPDLPFTWLDTASGEDFVFLLRREELPA